MTKPGFRLWGVPFTTLALIACDGASDPIVEARTTWITESEYEIGDVLQGDAVFSRIGDVRITPDGDRVVVLESGSARLTVWTPDGSLVHQVGRAGEGPAEFRNPNKVEFHPDGLLVRDSRRFTLFGHDGVLLRTIPPPPANLSFRGFRLSPRALLEGDGYIALPLVPARVVAGWTGDDPVYHWPVFRLWQSDGRWIMDTVVVLDKRNRNLSVRPPDGSFEWGYHGPQPYSDADVELYDSRTGSVVVVGRNAGRGEVRLVEVTALGDTVWDRSLRFPAAPIPAGDAVTYLEDIAESLASRSATSASAITQREALALLEEALYLPDFYPAVDYVEETSRGDVWLRTHESVDTLQVWYAVRRGDNESTPRRILLPVSFYASDVTDTHVWGVRYDTLGVNYVTGRRLVPLDEESD